MVGIVVTCSWLVYVGVSIVPRIGGSSQRDGSVESMISRKKHQCHVCGEIVEVLFRILGEGVAGLPRTWCVRCWCDVVGSLSTGQREADK